MTESRGRAEIIEIADQLELRVIDLDTGETRRYKSSVLDITDEGIAVAMPTDRRVPVPLPGGTAVVVSIWKDFAAHRFRSRVLKKVGGHIPQLILSMPNPEDITRKPRREFFRVETKIPARVYAAEEGERVDLPAIMIDLSGGGCRLQANRHLRAETPVHLDFDLPFPPDEDGLDRTRPLRQVPGKVKLSSAPAETDRRSRARSSVHLLGIEFEKLNNVVQNSLLRYVAFRQRELLNQLQEGVREDRGVSAAEVDELQKHLSRLEQDLKEAGQEVPAAAPDRAPAAESEETEELPPPGSVDELFASPPADPERTPVAPVVVPPQDTPSGKTILLVEDEDPLRKVLAEVLQHEGYAILQAANGQEALQVAFQTPVDLVITDLMMPKMNGWRLLAALRERGLDAPAIIITGYMSQEGQEVLTSRDISSFLVKPIDLEEMAREVRNILSPPAERPPRILAVDDEEDTRLLVSTCLKKAGFEVRTVAAGREALARVDYFKPDLVLLDIVMPDMNGFEVCRQLRSKPVTANVPVIMLTVKSSAEYVKKAVSLKINGYIVKPFNPDTLVARIRRTLQSKAPA